MPAAAPTSAAQIFLPLVTTGMQGLGDALSPDDIFFVAAEDSEDEYVATPMTGAWSHEVSAFTGEFQFNYPIPLPPAATGPLPSLQLFYNSGVVDRLTQLQGPLDTGPVGVGWSMEVGAIGNILRPCAPPGTTAARFLCESGVYYMNLGDVNTRLVEEAPNLYRLQDDAAWRIERLTHPNPDHPDAGKTYWRATAPDGTVYRFGGEFEQSTGADQNSLFYAPVGENSPQSKAWHWKVDQIEDTNGNLVSLFYRYETDCFVYAPNSCKTYVRGGHLREIHYAKRADQVVQPTVRVRVNLEVQCANLAGTSVPCDYPFRPNPVGPFFGSDLFVDGIQTLVAAENGTAWTTAAIYDLEQDGAWLDGIVQREGGDFQRSAFTQLEAEDADVSDKFTGVRVGFFGPRSFATKDRGQGEFSGWSGSSAYLLFEDVDFSTGADQVIVRATNRSSTPRSIDFRLDSRWGPLIARVSVDKMPDQTGEFTEKDWAAFGADVSNVSGVHDLYVNVSYDLGINGSTAKR